MTECIEREAAKKEFCLYFGGVSHAAIAVRLLDEIPAADVEPVRRARWKGEGMGEFSCSLCTEVVWGNEYNYCPNCGAKMNLEVSND